MVEPIQTRLENFTMLHTPYCSRPKSVQNLFDIHRNHLTICARPLHDPFKGRGCIAQCIAILHGNSRKILVQSCEKAAFICSCKFGSNFQIHPLCSSINAWCIQQALCCQIYHTGSQHHRLLQ